MYAHRKPLLILLLLLCLLPCGFSVAQQQDSARVKSYEEYESSTYEQNASSGDAAAVQAPETDTVEEAQEPPAESGRYTDATEEDNAPSYTVFSELRWPLPWQRRAISEQSWQKMTRDPVFRYKDPEEKPREPKETGSWWLRFFESIFRFLTSDAGKVLIICLVALIVIYLVIRVIQLRGTLFFSPKDKKLPQEQGDELADDYVPPSWERAIQDAAAAGNYRLAVRHSYRYLLHLLQERELIAFQTAKTNYQYAYELSGTMLHRPFLQLTRGYEYAWYGGLPVAKERFEAYYQEINGVKKDLH